MAETQCQSVGFQEGSRSSARTARRESVPMVQTGVFNPLAPTANSEWNLFVSRRPLMLTACT